MTTTGIECTNTQSASHSKPLLADYSTGFGGKYGVQTDRKDESAVGWEHQENLSQHESQKGSPGKNFPTSVDILSQVLILNYE